MRKLVVSMNITLDGYMAGPKCELDWHFKRWGSDMTDTLTRELTHAGTILLGRTTYNAMSRYWPGKASDFLGPQEDIAFAELMNSYEKIVFTNTLKTADWNNSSIISGDLRRRIAVYKNNNPEKKDIIVYGSAQLVLSLIEFDLVDEYQLWIHPVMLGKGKPMFRPLPMIKDLSLLRSQVFKSGVVFLCYAANGLK